MTQSRNFGWGLMAAGVGFGLLTGILTDLEVGNGGVAVWSGITAIAAFCVGMCVQLTRALDARDGK